MPDLLRVPHSVKASGDQELINTWRDMLKQLSDSTSDTGNALVPDDIGVTVQAWDDYLDTLAAVGSHASLLTEIGAQASDADLTALAGLSGVQGDIIYRDASQWQRLAKGTASQVLTMNAGATAPEWGSGGGYPMVGVWSATMSGNKSINNATTTAIDNWNTFATDTEGILSGTLTDLPTPSGANWAEVVFQGRFASNATGRRNFYIQYGTAGGTSNTYIGLDGRNTVSSAVTYATVVAEFPITGGTDEISLSVFQNSGGALNLESNFTRVTAKFFDIS